MFRKRSVFALVLIACFFFGLSMVTPVQASDPGYPTHFYGTIPYNDDPNTAWYSNVISVDLIAGKQVYLQLTLIDPPDGTDPDIFVGVDGIETWVWVGGEGWTGDPVAEEGFFYTPVDGTYEIKIWNYLIPGGFTVIGIIIGSIFTYLINRSLFSKQKKLQLNSWRRDKSIDIISIVVCELQKLNVKIFESDNFLLLYDNLHLLV